MEAQETKIAIKIEDEIKSSYLDYAMSVIIGRALPDIRDGLKPVHRRILYAMFREGLLSNKKHSKCAGVVGEVLKKYHPHGDTAVYDALVRLAQSWNLRYPLIDGQGNFGSIDGDPAAAYRYTEARLRKLAEEMLADIDKDTVDMLPNFDNTTEEPSVLPSKVPNLLINGSNGIAVGMATNIPPHNLREVVNALIHMVDNPRATTDDLMKFVKGPDFPTGGFILGREGIVDAFRTGKGHVRMRARTHIEELKGDRQAIIVTEIPYQVNKARLLEKIGQLAKDKEVVGISDVRDESDRHGMRIVIEVKRDAIPDVILNQLYKHTQLQDTFGVIMLAIVGGRPRILSLREMLEHFLTHRKEVVTRRTKFELKEAENREHILTGLVIAVDNIDEVIKIIRASRTTNDAREELMRTFNLSEAQSRAILDMKLARLTGLEREKLLQELEEVRALIAELKSILENESKLRDIIKKEFIELSDKYGDERKTQIVEASGDLNIEDLIADEDMVVTITRAGYIKRNTVDLYRRQKRGGRGKTGVTMREEDFVSDIFVASTHSYILIFSDRGKCYWLKVYDIPEASASARGKPIVNLITLDPGENVAAIRAVRDFSEPGRFLVFATLKGKVKKTPLSDFSRPRSNGIIALNIEEGDKLIEVELSDGSQEIFIGTKHGKSIRFKEENVRSMGRAAAGVRGITIEEDDEVIGMEVLNTDANILTASENGYGKRTALAEYPLQGRGGKGVITMKTTERNGNVVGILQVKDEDDLMIITSNGILIRTSVSEISVISRNTQGVKLISLEEGAKVVSITKFAEKSVEESNGSSSAASVDEMGEEAEEAKETGAVEENTERGEAEDK